MRPSDYILQKQRLWALRHTIRLRRRPSNSRHSPRGAGGQTYTVMLEDNLFEPLLPKARGEFEQADGGELRAGQDIGNMYALQSSSAAACNLFHYWRRLDELGPILRALRVPSTRWTGVVFEAKRPIAESLDRPPNIDVEIAYDAKTAHRAVGIECKLSEPYYGRPHSGISQKYFRTDNIWEGLPTLRQLAERLSPDDDLYIHLHAAQLLKHVLGMRVAYGAGRFRLLYLWYDVIGSEAARHRAEIGDFSTLARADGVSFSAITYQQVILHLAQHRAEHGEYVDYLAERYL